MSRGGRRRLTRSRLITAILAGAVTLCLGGCGRQDADSRLASPWPAEADDISVFRASPIAGGTVAGSAPYVVGNAGVWEYRDSALTRRALFAHGYLIALPYPRSSDPVLGGPTQLGSKVALLRPNVRQQSDGNGVVELEQSEDLVLIDPLDPSSVEVVTGASGPIRWVRSYEDQDAAIQLLLVELAREDNGGVVLLSRQAGRWTEVWSSTAAAEDERIHPRCYGFTTERDSGQVFMHMIYAIGNPTETPLRVMRVDAQGKVHGDTVTAPGVSGADDVTYLGEHNRKGTLGYSYGVRSEAGRHGLLLVEDGGKSVRMIQTSEYAPLATVVDSAGSLGIIAGAKPDGEQLRVFDVDSGGSVRVAGASNAQYATPLTGDEKWTVGAALLESRPTSSTALWSVSALYGRRVAGPWRLTPVVTDWPTPIDLHFGIQSMDELRLPEGRALVLGLSLERESAVAIVPLPKALGTR